MLLLEVLLLCSSARLSTPKFTHKWLPRKLYQAQFDLLTSFCDATGDIDFLIMAPISREPVACGAVLQALLARLLQQGLLLNEMNPSRPRPRDIGSATWLGLCKPAGSPYVRRIDFKVYPARCAYNLSWPLTCSSWSLGRPVP